MRDRCFLVTGAQGFIGSWVVKHLIEKAEQVVGLDVEDRPVRLPLLLAPEQLHRARFVRGHINDLGLIKGLIREHGVSHVVHLAGLQTPDCRENPILGATVNIVGTVTVFEAVKACGDQVRTVVYASSGAVLGSDDQYPSRPITDEAPRAPETLYGVFKTANEDCARIYWQDEGIRSVGLRPPVVYGVGRDRGLTAGTTLAIKAALLGQTYEIGFGGEANLEYAEDVAQSFVACALQAPEGALAFNMLGEILSVDAMIRIIEEIFPQAKGNITCVTRANRMANHVSDAGLQALIGPFRPLGYREGVRRTAQHFERLLREDRLGVVAPPP
jgi:nucleoside-diphosphate-sugar epimerase